MKTNYCCLCGISESLEDHHVIPISIGGENVDDNILTLCREHHGLLHNMRRHGDIKELTRNGLRKAKERGVILGTPANLNSVAIAKGQPMGVEAIKKRANSFANNILPMILEMKDQGISLNGIARELNKNGIKTSRGKTGSWTAQAVINILSRIL